MIPQKTILTTNNFMIFIFNSAITTKKRQKNQQNNEKHLTRAIMEEYLPVKLNGFGCKCGKPVPDEFSLRSGSEPVLLSLISDRSDSISDR